MLSETSEIHDEIAKIGTLAHKRDGDIDRSVRRTERSDHSDASSILGPFCFCCQLSCFACVVNGVVLHSLSRIAVLPFLSSPQFP